MLPGCRVPHNDPAGLGEEETAAARRCGGPGKWHGKTSKPGLPPAPHSTSEGEKVQHSVQPVKHVRCALIITEPDVSRCQLEMPTVPLLGHGKHQSGWELVFCLTAPMRQTQHIHPPAPHPVGVTPAVSRSHRALDVPLGRGKLRGPRLSLDEDCHPLSAPGGRQAPSGKQQGHRGAQSLQPHPPGVRAVMETRRLGGRGKDRRGSH